MTGISFYAVTGDQARMAPDCVSVEVVVVLVPA